MAKRSASASKAAPASKTPAGEKTSSKKLMTKKAYTEKVTAKKRAAKPASKKAKPAPPAKASIKAPAKKRATKKAPTKKVTTKKVSAKTPAKKAKTQKTVTPAPPAKAAKPAKAAAKKPSTKAAAKKPAKKATAKKAATKKPSTKAATKKPAAKKATTKKAATKKPSTKAAAKKPAKKATAKKAATKKPAAKKAATKKTAAKKTATKKAPARKPTPRKATKKPSATLMAPVLWRFKASKLSAYGIYVDNDHCWVGEDGGNVYALTHDGQLAHHYKLPDGVKSLVKDERWLYAGCDDANVYDLRAERPYLAYNIPSDDGIEWMDLFQGNLAVSDGDGGLTVMDFEGDQLWRHKGKSNSGWMIRCDESGLYHGPEEGVTKYDWKGKKLWSTKTRGDIQFGWQEKTEVYAGTTDGVDVLDKKTGARKVFCEAGPTLANAASPDGELIFSGGSKIQAFDRAGKRLWALSTGCGGPLSMQYFEGKLYLVTTSGYLACLDTSKAAIKQALLGKVPEPRELQAPQDKRKALSVDQALDSATADEGVVVECYVEGGRLRVRPISSGYNKSWHVQFPKDLREDGARFVVESLQKATQGGFYRTVGRISKLQE